MSTREYLSDIRFIDIKIKRKERQIAVLKDMTTDMTQKLSDLPKGKPMEDSPMASIIIKIIDLENEVKKLKDVLDDKKALVLSYILQLENDEYQTLLISRYLQFMSWDDISKEMHYTKRWLYKMHGTALVLFAAIFKE